jgi:uncharacterized protein (DUF342 family)
MEIPPAPGKDFVLTGGTNTTVSEDNKYLIALKSGYVYKQGDVICVGEQLVIKKDVDFSVGNIKYSGDVEVRGNVLPGFVVETDGNIIVKGEAESAKIISRNGSISLGKGIVGKGDMVVSAKKDIHLFFAQSAIISTEGTLFIAKYCLHCDASCDATAGLDKETAFIGGQLRAFSKIEIGIAGNDKGVETKITVVDKEEQAINDKIKEILLLQDRLTAEFESIKRQLKTKTAIFKQAGVLATPKQMEELKKWLDLYNNLSVKLKYVQEKVNGLQVELKKPRMYNGYIKIIGDIYPGTEVNLYGMVKIVKTHLINKLFRVKDGAVIVEG